MTDCLLIIFLVHVFMATFITAYAVDSKDNFWKIVGRICFAISYISIMAVAILHIGETQCLK